jgi:arylsulfatase A-like enzyme
VSNPVSLVDVYPSLVELAGLPVPNYLNGHSVTTLLHAPDANRGPAISSYGDGNTSIRTKRWRYIRYEDGSEELYHHKDAPNEWSNLAEDPKYTEVKERLAKFIPKDQHPGLKVQDWYDKHQK